MIHSTASAAAALSKANDPSPSLHLAMHVCHAPAAFLVQRIGAEWKLREVAGLSIDAPDIWLRMLMRMQTAAGLTELSGALLPPGASVSMPPAKDEPLHWIATVPVARNGSIVGLLGVADAQSRTPLTAGQREAFESLGMLAQSGLVEDGLRLNLGNFRALVETLPDAVFVQQDNRIQYANRRFDSLLGRPVEMHRSRTIFDLAPAEDHPRWESILASDGVELPETQEARLTRADGRTMPVEVRVVRVAFDGRPALACVVQDSTERRALQARLIFSDRMASVGTLAAGVAHEINNPLAFVVINLAFVSEQLERLAPHLPSDALQGVSIPELLDALGEAQEGSQRVRRIVRDLKTFSRIDEERREQVHIERVVETCMNMARHESRNRARLEKDFDPVDPITANEGQLVQVFLNLLVNAAQAIEPGHVEQNSIRVSIRPRDEGGVRVTVTDTGSGIEPQILPRIFDPFFTTRPVGAGTGLGLSICHNIVTSLGGRITVETEQGRGSSFHVDLPPEPPGEVQRDSLVPEHAPERRGRILVIDDEPGVGAALKRILRSHHDIEYLTKAREALERLKNEPPFDVILCDLMMPEMTGMEFFETLRKETPSIAERVVFFTGGAFTPEASAFLEHVPNRRIEKPIDGNHLHNVLQEVLAGQDETPLG
jgi:PAS domain S-box-containing protein